MVSSIRAYKVFVASPGGLDEEREAARAEMARFNSELMHELRTAFNASGWEDVPGTLGRPQATINEEIEQCDYLILIVWNRWGTRPSQSDRYTSGTEEEFFIAKELVKDGSRPMRDILVLFKGVPEEQLRDPGPQLTKVLQFKAKLGQEKEVYYKSFDDLDSFKFEVANRLRRWARISSELVVADPSAGSIAELQAVETGSRHADESQMVRFATDRDALALAEEFEAKGRTVQADSAYVKATVDGDVAALEKYARFLRRTGRLAKSLSVNQEIIDKFALSGRESLPLEVRTRALCNVGIIERKTGELRRSRLSLREAISTAREGGDDLLGMLAYALDNLSITLSRTGDEAESEVALRDALAAREKIDDELGQAKTLTIISRLERKSGRIEEAKSTAMRAVTILDGHPMERSALASAVSALGEVYESLRAFDDAKGAFARALEINESLGMPDAVALSCVQLARLYIEQGDIQAAERYAQRSLDENERASNREGVISSSHLLGRVYAASGREELAVAMLERAAVDYVAMRNPTGEAWARLHLARAQKAAGFESAAAESLRRARFLAAGIVNAALGEQVETGI
jgi:tetratricopeptide (TPR) repeat protein